MVVAAAVAIVCLLLLPHLVSRRTAITQSREFDRFSPGMRVLRTENGETVGPTQQCRSPQRSLSASASGHRTAGGTMSPHVEDGRRPIVGARAAHRENARVREIAQLRARRAARLANERAAGQRRFLASALTALATLAVAALAAFSVIGWAWVALPAVLLAAALGASRWAAIRSEAAGRSEDARLRELREGLDGRGRTSRPPRSGRPEGRAGAAPGSAGGPADEGAASESSRGTGLGSASPGGADTPGQVAEETSPGESGEELDDGAVQTPEMTGRPNDATTESAREGTEVPREPGAQGERTWSVTAVPQPTYAARTRVEGRQVHADTDLRGIPAVAASVPARPRAAGSASEPARSTQDVVASQPVVFDLDAVLDNRRAAQ